MKRAMTLAICVIMLAMTACIPFFGSPDLPDTDLPDVSSPESRRDVPTTLERTRETESVPTATMEIEAARGSNRSLESFGACINHYHRELRFAPWDTEITVKEGIVWGQFSQGFANNSGEWVVTLPVALCLDHAPTPSRDELSAKCVIETAEWYLREYPDIEYAVGPFALVACLPPYDG